MLKAILVIPPAASYLFAANELLGRRFLGERLLAIVSGPPRPPNDDALLRSSVWMRRHPSVMGAVMSFTRTTP